ncbi:MAG: hypothetical protein J5767_13425 [Paludibacteraceae bacterium]|nr:hypothetical protein [Paludibacteraceae bacterium]
MNKKKLIIGAMISVFLVSLLKMTLIPGRGILTTLITISAALLFYIVPMRKVILNLFSDKRKAETQSPAYANVLEAFYATFMPIFTIGILFKLLHWPGANIMLSIGFITILICACLVLFIYKASNCVYFSSARAIAIATILYALLFGTQYYYHFLETIRWEGSDVLEYYNKARTESTEESYNIFVTERNKLLQLKDKELYNTLNKEYIKAQEEAKETNAQVLYIIDDVAYDTDTPNKVFLSIGIVEPYAISSGIKIDKYLKAIGSSTFKHNKFILVTDNVRQALSDLENLPWQTDSFSVKTGNEIYKFGPNIQE